MQPKACMGLAMGLYLSPVRCPHMECSCIYLSYCMLFGSTPSDCIHETHAKQPCSTSIEYGSAQRISVDLTHAMLYVGYSRGHVVSIIVDQHLFKIALRPSTCEFNMRMIVLQSHSCMLGEVNGTIASCTSHDNHTHQAAANVMIYNAWCVLKHLLM